MQMYLHTCMHKIQKICFYLFPLQSALKEIYSICSSSEALMCLHKNCSILTHWNRQFCQRRAKLMKRGSEHVERFASLSGCFSVVVKALRHTFPCRRACEQLIFHFILFSFFSFSILFFFVIHAYNDLSRITHTYLFFSLHLCLSSSKLMLYLRCALKDPFCL